MKNGIMLEMTKTDLMYICFYHRGPLRSFEEQENKGIYFRVIRERRSKIEENEENEDSDGEHV